MVGIKEISEARGGRLGDCRRQKPRVGCWSQLENGRMGMIGMWACVHTCMYLCVYVCVCVLVGERGWHE